MRIPATLCSFVFPWLAAMALSAGRVQAETVVVHNTSELRIALAALKNGTRLQLAPGEYSSNNYVKGIERLTVEALDSKSPPHFKNGSVAWHFSRCPGLTLRHLRISDQTGNGLNLDDGGKLDSLVEGITLEHIEITDIGPRGNCDGVKASGLSGLTIRKCALSGWGGQGIDLVGCHKVLITQCRFSGKEGFSATAGVQAKGGSSLVAVEKCHFHDAGERPVNVGGSTGLEFFRPRGAKSEASQIIVRDNVIEGSYCAAAFVGVDVAEFSGNTVLFPKKWIFRILQENTGKDFVPCRNVTIRENNIVFRKSDVQIEVNVGANTAPETFRFEKNRWFAEDRPQSSKPQLPTEELDGTYGVDPR